jgi:small subunit ribosomal protein S8
MDSVANMLTSLVNAQHVGKERVAVPHSRFKEQLARLFQEKGIVSDVRVQAGPHAKLIITLAYDAGQPRVRQVVRLSKPGRRLYVRSDQIPWGRKSVSTFILSTSQGLMDDKSARAAGLGGELVCELRR